MEGTVHIHLMKNWNLSDEIHSGLWICSQLVLNSNESISKIIVNKLIVIK